ncbi:BadF/BadG/BcrA/BcrD ATPase family protein [Streptomyces sp. NPDC057620]|uniref:BadF/BadG/BcrA/BcrD ATPase family protein n=1 Tax=Streptomyces sp. NPDC057620 TaxID=3346185 RepID=UPI0036D193E1
MPDFTPVAVGIDVGGTKTHVRARAGGYRPEPGSGSGSGSGSAADPGAEPAAVSVAASAAVAGTVADHVRESTGWRPHDPASAAAWLAALIDDVLPRGTRPAAVAVGGHACETPRQCEEIRSALHALLRVPCRVVGDAELLVPAAGLAKGVGLVAGTGSVAVGHLPDGAGIQVGGWGAVLGDEGGSAGLVREAARALWAAHDRGEPPDVLADRLTAAFGVPEVPALGAALESAADVSAEWGRHAPSVFAAAEEGSSLARAVIAEGGRALARLVVLLAGRGVPVDDVVVAGGAILGRPVLYEAFTAALAEALPSARPRPLRVPPVEGAVALARALL